MLSTLTIGYAMISEDSSSFTLAGYWHNSQGNDSNGKVTGTITKINNDDYLIQLKTSPWKLEDIPYGYVIY